jgi:hypothetical protein
VYTPDVAPHSKYPFPGWYLHLLMRDGLVWIYVLQGLFQYPNLYVEGQVKMIKDKVDQGFKHVSSVHGSYPFQEPWINLP